MKKLSRDEKKKYIYIYSFGRHIYPKWLTVHLKYAFISLNASDHQISNEDGKNLKDVSTSFQKSVCAKQGHS